MCVCVRAVFVRTWNGTRTAYSAWGHWTDRRMHSDAVFAWRVHTCRCLHTSSTHMQTDTDKYRQIQIGLSAKQTHAETPCRGCSPSHPPAPRSPSAPPRPPAHTLTEIDGGFSLGRLEHAGDIRGGRLRLGLVGGSLERLSKQARTLPSACTGRCGAAHCAAEGTRRAATLLAMLRARDHVPGLASTQRPTPPRTRRTCKSS